MSLACESEIRVQNEYALRFSLVAKPVPVLEYIKAVSSLIGASHILAVFEEADNLKMFFDDKRYVDTLIRSGVHVMGRHVQIDYVIPPGVKVVMSNVDPVVLNCDMIRLLSTYGTVVSPVIRPPICDDAELCHIGYGVRYAYMVINGILPPKVEFKFGDQLCSIKLRIEDKPEPFPIPVIKEDLDESSYEGESNPSIVSPNNGFEDELPGPSGLSTNFSEINISDPVVVRVEGSTSIITPQIDYVKTSKKETVHVPKRRGRPKTAKKLIRRGQTATARAARKIKANFKHKYITGKRHYKKRVAYKSNQIPKLEIAAPPVLKVFAPALTESFEAAIPQTDVETSCDLSSVVPVLEPQKLLMFLDEVKHQRAPIELVKKYLDKDYSKETVSNFIKQLHQYNRSHNDQNLKMRVSRIIKCIADS